MQTRTVPLLPPAELIRACPQPGPTDFATTGDLIDDDQVVRAALKSCAERVKALADWRGANAR